jgi:broad specificity phosphatase PhoE
MSEIFLVRHAQASFRSENYDRLSDLGVRQGEILGDYFAGLGLNFDAFYSGCMERQKDTAYAVMSRLPPSGGHAGLLIAEEFNEYDAHTIIKTLAPVMTREDPTMTAALENLFTDGKSLERVFEWAMFRWASGQCHVPEVESWENVKQRVRDGLAKVVGETGVNKRVAVFTSGGAICATMQMALGLGDLETIRLALRIRNASVSTFQYRDNGPLLVSFNSVAHLEQRKDPELITYR